MEIALWNLRIIIEIPYKSLGMLLALIGLTILSYFLMTKLRRKRVMKFGNFQTLRRVEGYKKLLPSPLLLVFKIVVITLLFLVATESIQLNILKPVANTDFVLAIDSSQTMLFPDYEPNRLEFAKSIAKKWLSELPAATKISVIKFSERAIPVVPLTTNFFEVEKGIESIEVDLNASGTAIGDALTLASSILSTSNKQRFVILITDGKNNIGKSLNESLKDLKEKHVVVYAIGIGSTPKTKELFEELKQIAKERKLNLNLSLPELDEKGIKFISEQTGGKYFVVTNESGFEESFKDIIIRNERIPLNSDYYILLFISILLILELYLFSIFGAI